MLVGRMPPRGALLAFPQECEISKLAPLAGQGESSPKVRVLELFGMEGARNTEFVALFAPASAIPHRTRGFSQSSFGMDMFHLEPLFPIRTSRSAFLRLKSRSDKKKPCVAKCKIRGDILPKTQKERLASSAGK